MKAKAIFFLFAVAAAVQIAVPVFQIWKYEDTLRTGQAFKFRTAPVDPYDPFRGRYVQLAFADTRAKEGWGADSSSYEMSYVTLGVDAEGFVTFEKLQTTRPETGAYLRVSAFSQTIVLPFDRFYMEETEAQLADRALLTARSRDGSTRSPTYALVRVKDGRGVIEDLYVDNLPIREFLKREKANSTQ